MQVEIHLTLIGATYNTKSKLVGYKMDAVGTARVIEKFFSKIRFSHILFNIHL